MLKLRQVWIRIIYITERIQQVTSYCCSPCEAGEAGLGYSQPKVLNLNQSLKSSIAWIASGNRNSECVEAS